MTVVREVEESPRLAIYEVDAHGTLSAYGVEPPKINRDIYPRIKLDNSMSIDMLISVIERVTPLASHVQELAEDALADMRSELEDGDIPAFELPALRAVVDELDKAGDNLWRAWMRQLEGGPLKRLRREVLDWPDARIDWSQVEAFPWDWGLQGKALSDFTYLTEENLISIGVKIVYAEHPGSTYHAAELHADIDGANAQAEQIGLNIRFVREGESADRFSVLQHDRKETAAERDLAQDLLQHFVPNFGTRLELRLGRDPGVSSLPTEPPREFLYVHDSELFNSAWSRILRAVREPVHRWIDDDGGVHVQVLGVGVYSFHADGQVSCHLWKIDGIGRQRLVPSPAETMSLDHLPWRFVWLGIWERAFALEVEATMNGGDVAVRQQRAGQYAKWAFSVFLRRVRRSCDLRLMRQRIAKAMPIDPLAMDIARQANMVERKAAVRVSTYNRIAGNLGVFRQLERDAPRLALCFDMLSQCDAFPTQGEPLDRLSRYLAKWRLTKRCWRMVARSGPALWRPMVEFYDHPGREAAIDYLRLLDKLGWHEPADPAFMRIVLSMRGGPGGCRSRYSESFNRLMATLKRIVNWFELADALGRASITDNLHMVLGWLDDGGAAIIAKAARQPTWANLIRRAKLGWDQRLKEQSVLSPTWAVPVERMVVQAFEVRFISTARELVEEALSMRHCIFDFAEDCADNVCLIGSVRHLSTGHRIATALFRPAGHAWKLDGIAGFANGAVSDGIRSVATIAAVQLADVATAATKSASASVKFGMKGLRA